MFKKKKKKASAGKPTGLFVCVECLGVASSPPSARGQTRGGQVPCSRGSPAPRRAPGPSPAGAPFPPLPSAARCGGRSPAPRLTLQLGRRFAIGVKIAASPRTPVHTRLPAPGPGCPLSTRAPRCPPARPRPLPAPGSDRPCSGRLHPALRLARSARSRSARSAAMQRRGALFSLPGGSGSRKMAAGDIGELLVPHMPKIRVPRSGDRVYKNECAFSYDSPVSEAPGALAAP